MTVFGGSAPCGKGNLYKSVIDRSMTVFRGSTPCGKGNLYKSVIDRSMTVFRESTPCGKGNLYKSVIVSGDRHHVVRGTFIKVSLTGQ